MTKQEKKEFLSKLIVEINQCTDIDEYATKRSQLFHEIVEAGYPENIADGIVITTNEWCKDFDMNMHAKILNQTPPNNDQFIAMSAIGLVNQIDLSLLPD